MRDLPSKTLFRQRGRYCFIHMGTVCWMLSKPKKPRKAQVNRSPGPRNLYRRVLKDGDKRHPPQGPELQVVHVIIIVSNLNQKYQLLYGTMFPIDRIQDFRTRIWKKEQPHLLSFPLIPPQNSVLSNTPILGSLCLEESVTRIRRLPPGDVTWIPLNFKLWLLSSHFSTLVPRELQSNTGINILSGIIILIRKRKNYSYIVRPGRTDLAI